MTAPYTLAQCKAALQRLSPRYSPEEVRALGFLLLEEVAGLPPYWWYSAPEHVLEPPVAARLQGAIQRLQAGEPIQYILGTTQFGHLRLHTDARALIPRPETQELVRWIQTDLQQGELLPGGALDLCTGSGCLALALAHTFQSLPQAPPVWACDISRPALDLAALNARTLRLPVRFFYADILQGPCPSPGADFPQDLALLTANPPYVRQSEREAMDARVLDHEPALALFVPDQDPLLFYRAVARWGAALLRPGACAYVELNEALGPQTAEVFRALGYTDLQLRQDLQGKDRMLRARR